jgi:hypothetical protein
MCVYTISDGEQKGGEGGAREMCMTVIKMFNKTKNKHAVMAVMAAMLTLGSRGPKEMISAAKKNKFYAVFALFEIELKYIYVLLCILKGIKETL